MKVSLKKALTSTVAISALVVTAAFAPVSPALAADDCATGAGGISGGVNCANPNANDNTQLFGSDSIFTTVVNTLLFIIGAISVIMLIYGGIRYTLSAGDASRVTAAKNTIMYAIVGLIVAFLAFAVVNWVLSALGGASA